MFKKHPLMMRVRDEPLEQCPDLSCRRSGRCHADNPEWECRKYVRTPNEFRIYIANKIRGFRDEWERHHPEEAEAARNRPLPDWATVGLPAVRKAIEIIKAQRQREAAAAALEGDKPKRKRPQ